MATIRVNAASDGDNTIIASPGAGRHLLIHGFCLTGQTTAGTALIRSGAAGTIHCDLSLGTSGGVSFGSSSERDREPIFMTDTNTALVINCSAGLDVRGMVTYSDVAG